MSRNFFESPEKPVLALLIFSPFLIGAIVFIIRVIRESGLFRNLFCYAPRCSISPTLRADTPERRGPPFSLSMYSFQSGLFPVEHRRCTCRCRYGSFHPAEGDILKVGNGSSGEN